uniref:Uncharacterized protein n=1 Tax=Lotus japonicus TaxID=34305 RepID=I3SWG7_LOTJA|nr:unknown [Lotus japonicus]
MEVTEPILDLNDHQTNSQSVYRYPPGTQMPGNKQTKLTAENINFEQYFSTKYSYQTIFILT